MFEKVLVANRGEIAVRVIRALREMNIISVAVYSSADENAMHAELADEAICIGPANGLESYSNPVSVISAALVTDCDAVHPGYGFLSERSDFASLCEEVGITFIGPNSQIIDDMGNKNNARLKMKNAGVPITPGSESFVSSIEDASRIADEIGYPLMIKAADGGGGKGMRRVQEESELVEKFTQAMNETQSIYGNKNLYIEKVIDPAKHIEIQLLADHHGHVIHLGERDCSLQRNHQKVIEFAPATSMDESAKESLYQTAVQAAEAIGYTNAGTIEFLLDEDQNFYFMEMNTRLQVEHPITEMITGIDIVKEQVRIAAGETLSVKQDEVEFNGFAIECRLNAEDPKNNFMPSSGYINRLILPSGGLGLRTESGVYPQYTLPPFYDSMIAKIIVYQPTREEAFDLMNRALVEVVVEGLQTNVELLDDLIYNEEVYKDQFHTKWLEEEFLPSWKETNMSTEER